MTFSALLQEALTKPGKLSNAYRAFHDYSVGNMVAAIVQCDARGIAIGPIATFAAWKEKGRSIKKGEKAIALCMPITCKAEKENGEEVVFSRFVWKNNWFVLSQTTGEDVPESASPEWDKAKALQSLGIEEAPFAHPNGNMQGYAAGRAIHINPLAAYPHKTRFHEMAHIVLGHTEEGECADGDSTPINIREVEAESVAYILCALLGLPGLEASRAYVQHWHNGSLPEKNAQRIFKAANTILKAGA